MTTDHHKEMPNMSDAAREARNKYQREWAKRHPEQVKAAKARYWERKAQAAQAGKSS